MSENDEQPQNQYSTSKTYSRRELSEVSEGEQIDVMLTWFHENFEDPAERTPYVTREGGYQWVWGGPYNAVEELEGEFGNTIPFEVIEIEKDGLFDWAPTPRPGDYDEDDFGDDIELQNMSRDEPDKFDEDNARSNVTSRLDELEAAIRPLLQQPAGIGHNNPPEEVGDAPLTRTEWEDLQAQISALSTQTKSEKPDHRTVEEKASKFGVYAKKIAFWVGKRLEKGADAFVITAATTFGASIAIDMEQVVGLLRSTIEAAQTWATVLSFTF